MKRFGLLIFLSLITALILTGCRPAKAEAAQEVEPYTCGDYTYTILADGTAKIMQYAGQEESVNIPETLNGKTVAEISVDAFSSCYLLCEIAIPKSVVSLEEGGNCLFDSNYALKNIYVSSENPTYTSVDGVLFRKTDNAIIQYPQGKKDSTYSIPEGTVSIGAKAFSSCSALTEITIPKSVIEIGDSAFDGCASLTAIHVSSENTAFFSNDGVLFRNADKAILCCPPADARFGYRIPDGTTAIGASAFSGCENLTEIVIPNSVTSIGDFAFYGCISLTKIALPDTLTAIGSHAFRDCTSLTAINIPEGVTSIEAFTFACCRALTEITIPQTVTQIGENAFSHCDSLIEIAIPGSVRTIGFAAFCPCKSLNAVTIQNGVVSIGSSAFASCDALREIVIPESVAEIEYDAFDCESLTQITVSHENAVFESVDGVLFRKTDKTILRYPQAKTGSSYTIPEGTTAIGADAFGSCTFLTEIVIPQEVTSIGTRAFQGCVSLTELVIPQGVASIGDHAFIGCISLQKMTIPMSVTSIGEGAFLGCDHYLTLIVPHDSYALQCAWENKIWYEYSDAND